MNLLQVIKQAAMEAVKASEPCDFVYGTVKSESPLIVLVEQKTELRSEFLILTNNVKDHKQKITLEGQTDKQEITVYNKLKKGERVILIKKNGGQKYIVLDKIGAENDTGK